MYRRTAQVLAAISLFFFTMHGVATADEFHYNNFQMGDRATGMGGAYTAVADDPSGLYYNPAGIVYSTGRNLSASVNAFYTSTKKYDNVIAGNGWERKSAALLPNFFGLIQPMGRFKFGFSYAVPDSTREDQDQIFYNLPSTLAGYTATQYVINYNDDDNTYELGPTLALEVNEHLAVGLTLYWHYRGAQTILNQNIALTNGVTDRYEVRNVYSELHERGYKPVLGVMWTPVDKWSLGLSLGKVLVYSSSIETQTTFKDPALVDTVTWNQVGSTQKRKYPYEIRGGVAFFPNKELLIAADLAYYTKVSDPENGDRVSVLNVALGAEYFFDKSWAARGGFFTNMANTPDIDPAKNSQSEKVDIYGISASVSNFTRNTSVSFGLTYTMGDGEAQIISGSSAIQNVSVDGLMIFLSSSYSF